MKRLKRFLECFITTRTTHHISRHWTHYATEKQWFLLGILIKTRRKTQLFKRF